MIVLSLDVTRSRTLDLPIAVYSWTAVPTESASQDLRLRCRRVVCVCTAGCSS